MYERGIGDMQKKLEVMITLCWLRTVNYKIYVRV